MAKRSKKAIVKKRAAQKDAPKTVKKSRPFWPFGIALFALLLFIDQHAKSIIVSLYEPHVSAKVAPGLWFTYVQNRGMTWGFLQGTNELLIWLSIILFGLLIYLYDKFTTYIEKLCYVLIMVGLWGNLLDRVLYGFVVDFIDVRWWPVFNIADACIVVAVIVLVLEQWKKRSQKMT